MKAEGYFFTARGPWQTDFRPLASGALAQTGRMIGMTTSARLTSIAYIA
jgi:hypothetical protein